MFWNGGGGQIIDDSFWLVSYVRRNLVGRCFGWRQSLRQHESSRTKNTSLLDPSTLVWFWTLNQVDIHYLDRRSCDPSYPMAWVQAVKFINENIFHHIKLCHVQRRSIYLWNRVDQNVSGLSLSVLFTLDATASLKLIIVKESFLLDRMST